MIVPEVEYKIGNSGFLKFVEGFYNTGVECFREIGVHEVADFVVSPFEEFGYKNGVCIHFPGSDGDGLSRRSYGIPFLFSPFPSGGSRIGKFAEVAFCESFASSILR